MAWLTGYNYRKEVTIPGTYVDASQTDFPVLIKLTNADVPYANVLTSGGYDIKFTQSDGSTLLSHELVYYNNLTGDGEFWVKIPTLSATSTTIYVYYGKAGDTDTTTTAVWSNNYVGVWHLQALTDSSGGGWTLTATGAVQVDAKIFKGYSFDGVNDNLKTSADGPDCSGDHTIEMWILFDSFGTHNERTFLTKGDLSSDSPNYAFGKDSSLNLWWEYGRTSTTYRATNSFWSFSNATWYHLTVAVDAGVNVHFYQQGGSKSTIAWPGGAGILTNTQVLSIGETVGGVEDFPGDMDEIRISNVLRTDAWIKANYYSVNDGLGISYGTETGLPTLTTQAASSVDYTTATGNGTITATGGDNPATRGFCWAITVNPDTGDNVVNESGSFSTGAYSLGITGMTAGQEYHMRAYATNIAGTAYGNDVTFGDFPHIDSIGDAPDPVVLGNQITFTANWSWTGVAHNVNVYICKTNAFTAGVGCDGGEWGNASNESSSPTTVNYVTAVVGLQNYYVFIEDYTNNFEGDNNPSSGTFDCNITNLYCHFEAHRGSSTSVKTYTTGTNCSIAEREYDMDFIANKIQVVGSDNTVLSAIKEDATSQSEYGIRELTYTDRSVESTSDANEIADRLLAKLKDPLQRIKLVILDRSFLEVVGDVITLNDTNTGLSSSEFRVMAIHRKFGRSGDELIYEISNRPKDIIRDLINQRGRVDDEQRYI